MIIDFIVILISIDDIEKYFCMKCSKQYGPPICK
jgi:hypothetical protein